MRKFIVESKSFAAPNYPGHPESTMMLQSERSTGNAAFVGLALAVIALITFGFYNQMDNRPVIGTEQCKAKQATYRAAEKREGLPHSFDAEVEQCRSEHGR